MATFKQINNESHVDKKVKKAGLSLAVIFSKEEVKKYDLHYDKVLRLDEVFCPIEEPITEA